MKNKINLYKVAEILITIGYLALMFWVVLSDKYKMPMPSVIHDNCALITVFYCCYVALSADAQKKAKAKLGVN